MGKRRIQLSEQIRRALADCGMTRYAVSKATGIDQATLSRFMSGERGLPMKTLDVLADFLDLNIIVGKRPKAKGR
jgi:transcriptional regulator with XRE-family HTH domain